ncbi:unnamed protein product [Zymoseptoria tritici ST99CH_3D7]|uniref:Uncharacterized protein n=2 Tax=Zymoseptoria tritici TaxID=1047171 RepID=A0A1X7RF78_ZYMT9|nr:unnamed protein product [Zymoseptoria tritici ST99CH_3D7]SMR42220.1 unnamed protein product [Zymoseptoria tritici ST99CH_1E4]
MATPRSPPADNATITGRARAGTASSVARSVRSATEKVLNQDLPSGFLAATADVTASAPSIDDVRNGSAEGRRSRDRSYSNNRRSRRLSRESKEFEGHGHRGGGLEAFPPLSEEKTNVDVTESQPVESVGNLDGSGAGISSKKAGELRISEHESAEEPVNLKQGQRVYTNGYVPPPKLPWKSSTANALRGFWKWFLTPVGFLVTLYGLNVVAWGGMLFLLLCGAAPAMCWADDSQQGWVYDCNHIDSARRRWIEYNSQTLNALFCVTGFGLIPWRFRDLYYIMAYRMTSERKHGKARKMQPLRKLAGHYRNWFRLPGSETLDRELGAEHAAPQTVSSTTSAELESGDLHDDLRLPLPESKRPIDPPTGHRAPPTAIWKADFFIWCQIWNTFFQACLCGSMWGMNRIERPSWSTGLFVALACGIAGIGGIVSYIEGRRVKKVEGVPPTAAQLAALGADHDTDSEIRQTQSGSDSIPMREKKKHEAEARV